ncbi:MAG: hypothetical protein K6E30_03710 [Lachnospiraceae bacterium]|nr:hypothetical protein [Lachnospiraceae bacterium]
MKKMCRGLAAAVLFTALFFSYGCADTGNRPYEPDTPAPENHEGTFVSDCGSMTFNGDGETVVIDFNSELAALLGLPEGEQSGSYVFLSGDLPPVGSVEVRYDAAHEMKLTVGDQEAVVQMAVVSEEGSVVSGVNTVRPDRIPMYFSEGGNRRNVIFLRQ